MNQRLKAQSKLLSLVSWITVLGAMSQVQVANGVSLTAPGPKFEIAFPASVHSQPITGRMLLVISRKNDPEVRLQVNWLNSPPIFGVDVDQLKAAQKVVIDSEVLGYPVR